MNENPLTKPHEVAEIFDQPPGSVFGLPIGGNAWEEHFTKPFHVRFDGGWDTRNFARRCDASRYAKRRAEKVIHWYSF